MILNSGEIKWDWLKMNVLNEIQKYICHSSAAFCPKNKIHKTKKQKQKTFLIISAPRIKTLIEVRLKDCNELKAMWIYNIYVLDKTQIPCLCFKNK